MRARLLFDGLLATTALLITLTAVTSPATAAPRAAAPLAPVTVQPTDASSDFSIQISPSPLVTTVTPGVVSTVEMQIRNSGNATEALKIAPRSFTVDNASQQVVLNDTTPPGIADWIGFSALNFTVLPGQTYTETVRFALPKDTGFSYSFALLLSRQKDVNPVSGGRLIKASVAVFTLVNVDRPGATSKLDVAKFTISKHIYEFLPANLDIQFKNTGNTIVQPYGNIFIQRGATDKAPISTLPVNEKRGYILPGSTRTLAANWSAGFPSYQSGHLVWDWGKAANFRIGKYTAKLVAVYNDGHGDVPIEGVVSFWVIPWKLIGGALLIILLIVLAIVSFVWRIVKLTRRRKKPVAPKPADTPEM